MAHLERNSLCYTFLERRDIEKARPFELKIFELLCKNNGKCALPIIG